MHSLHRAEDAQITSFYQPDQFNDIEVESFGVGFQRQFSLDPLFDLRLRGNVKYVSRTGIVEFLPDHTENFLAYEAKPSISRFFGSDKVTLAGTYVFMDIPDLPGGSPSGSKRGQLIIGGELTYALYAPVTLPFTSFRTPTRGWYWYLGYVQSQQVYGLRTVLQQDAYIGTRLETPTDWDFTLQATYFTSDTAIVDENDVALPSINDLSQRIKGLRASTIITRRILNPDEYPGLKPTTAGFAADALNLVVPISWDLGLQGPQGFATTATARGGQSVADFGIDIADHTRDYENVRGGAELWFKFYAPVLWGSSVLSTVGYDAQYFYNLDQVVHSVRANVRLGWGDEL